VAAASHDQLVIQSEAGGGIEPSVWEQVSKCKRDEQRSSRRWPGMSSDPGFSTQTLTGKTHTWSLPPQPSPSSPSLWSSSLLCSRWCTSSLAEGADVADSTGTRAL